MEVLSASIINILILLKQAALIDANKNCDDSDDCGKWDGKSTLFKLV